MKALVIRGKLKGKEVEIDGWCNDWFMLKTGDHTIDRNPLSPTALAFSQEDIKTITEHKNNGMMFEWFCVYPYEKRNGRYIFTFKKRK